MRLTRLRCLGNSAANGGGGCLVLQGCVDVDLVDSVFEGNRAEGQLGGGGTLLLASIVRATGGRFVGNKATVGG